MGIVLVFSLLVTTEFLEVNCFITVVTTKLFAACDPFFAFCKGCLCMANTG